MPPALLAAEAWGRGVVEPLVQTINDQQRQLVTQAETIGDLRATVAAREATISSLKAQREAQVAETATRTSPTLKAFLVRWWWAGTGVVALTAIILWALLPR